jgi:ubiquinone/menaquinone biosynthesis C-methylase UbiE
MIRTHTEMLADAVALADRDVLDVGCGAGGLVRWLRSHGARPTGAECGDEMRRRARAADPEHPDAYVDAAGQDLPFEPRSFDVVVYSYSLHHVPIDAIPDAVAEARRVLRTGGTLYVVEPAVDRPERAVAPMVTDETVERTAAQAALDDAERHGFALRLRDEYATERAYDDFAAWEYEVVGIDPERAAAMETHRDAVRANFERLGEERDGRWWFRRTNLRAVFNAR